MSEISQLEELGKENIDKLETAGINSIERLLERTATPRGRKELSDLTGISRDTLHKWLQYLDLSRIEGLSPRELSLLEAAGVNNILELSRQDPAEFIGKLQEVNDRKNVVDELPSEEEVTRWIHQAEAYAGSADLSL